MTLEDQINLELACGRPDSRPRQITTETSEEFYAVCDRQTRRELVIESVSVGDGPAQFVFWVHYCV